MLDKLRPRNWTLLVLWICAPLAAHTTKDVSFRRDVVPILSEKCLKCHGLASPMANLDLKSRESALKGGQHGPAIVPGDGAASNLYKHVAGQQEPRMPLGGRLTDDEIAVLKAWIDRGAEWDAGLTLSASVPAANGPAAEKQFTAAQRNFWAFKKIVQP